MLLMYANAQQLAAQYAGAASVPAKSKLNKMKLAPLSGLCPRSAPQIMGSLSRPSPASRPSTVTIGKQWMKYQGANNWDGLLNPLDDTLRSEIIRYGEFVKAAYTCFNFDPSSTSYASCRFPKDSLLCRSGLPDTGYRVTRQLHATTGCFLPKWANVCPSWLSHRSSWIGYVAVCMDKEEIARLGRRDVFIAYRGTATCLEWLENLRATLIRLPSPASCSFQTDPMVECGFWSLFTSSSSAYCSLRDQVRDEVGRILATYKGSNELFSLTVTGHSLGAALAVLTAYDITETFRDSPMVTVVSFGGPRIGNASFCRRLEELGGKVLRIVNTHDIVTKVPGFVVDQDHSDESEGLIIPNWLLSKMGWAYADIGCELRLSSSRRTANVVASHDLNVYLNLVNQLSATCTFN